MFFGSWAYWGSTMNEAYMPAPSRNAARLVVHTPRIRIIVMSISGSRLRISFVTHSAQNTSPMANTPSVLGEPQPQTVVCAMAISTADMPMLIRTAETQLTVAFDRTGDSGM